MIAKIKDFVKTHFYDIILIIIIGLLVMLAFAIGYIVAKYQPKTPIQFEKYETHTSTYSFIS
jgi:hypothetical protein